ncbi:MAG: VanZ family protein [Arenimonas sp.]
MSADLRHRRLWLALWIAGMLLGVYLSLRPVPAVAPALPHLDKLIHVGGYAVLAAFATCLFSGSARLRALAGVWLLGAAIELAQGLLPTGRLMEAADLLANSVGIMLGSALCWRRNPLLALERMID